MHGTGLPGPSATTPGLGDPDRRRRQQGNPTIDDGHCPAASDSPQVKQAYNNAGLTVKAGRAEELALMLTSRAFAGVAAEHHEPRQLRRPWRRNLKLYRAVHRSDHMPGKSEIAGQAPVVDPDIVGVAGASPDIVQIQNDPDALQPWEREPREGTGCAAARQREHRERPRYQRSSPGTTWNIAEGTPRYSRSRPGNVNMATDVDVQAPSNESPNSIPT
jgi:hypothetical protein